MEYDNVVDFVDEVGDAERNSQNVINQPPIVPTNSGIEERPWKIQVYENIAQSRIKTADFREQLIGRKSKYYEIDTNLHTPNVFAGPISDDVHDVGYNTLNGYMNSIIGEVTYMENWFYEYMNDCTKLEEETDAAKRSVIDENAEKLTIEYVI